MYSAITHKVKRLTGILFLFVFFAVGCEKEEIRPPFSPTMSTVNMPVRFEPNKSGESYSWTFGDSFDPQENSSNEKNPCHTYLLEGMYTVVLRVYNHSTYEEYSEVITISK
jgi:PKD repeat protein